MSTEERMSLAAKIRAEVGPLIDRYTFDGGYDCCGCSTYDVILEHCIAIVEEREYAPN